MTRPDRRTTALVALLGFGLLALLYAVWAQKERADADRAVVTALLAKDAENTQELAALRTLIQALSDQVRSLGGTPVTLPPTPAATPPSARPTAAAPATSPTRAARTPSAPPPPSATPRPSPSSTPVSPTPSPSTRVCVGPLCVSVGGTP